MSLGPWAGQIQRFSASHNALIALLTGRVVMKPEGVPLLQVCGLAIAYPGSSRSTRAVDDVSLSIARGETVGLLGESGSGKSSIALAILGLLPDQTQISGSIRFDGLELVGLSERRFEAIRGARVAAIYQEPELALNPVLTAGTQIIQVLRAHSSSNGDGDRERALDLLREAGFGEEAPRIFVSYPHQLSGGQRQRVLIAQALAANPELVIADEPTASVDAAVQADILGMLRHLQRARGLGVLFISHSPTVLATMADRLYVLSEGRVVEEGATNRLLTSPVHPRTRSLVEAGSPCRAAHVSPPGGQRGPLLEIRGVTKTYPRRHWLFGGPPAVTALANATLTIPAGSTLGLVGPSGSGKSTLARCLARLEEPDAGDIRFRGLDVRRLRGVALRAYRREVQVVFQDPAGALNPRFSAGAIVAEPLVVQGIGTPRERRARTLELLAEVGISPARANDRPACFSGGERQRLALARALALSPSLLVLDEALSGIDLPAQQQILELLERLRERRALACLVISHDLALVSRIAQEIAVMQDGCVVEPASAGEPVRRYA
jgi:peptide/nickel transport system ATP-binding protein